jgi:hypothetical protein
VTAPTPPDAARRALRQLWLVVAVVVFDVAVGGGWDAAYHRTEPFDGFFSPPHLFIYSLATVALALVARLVLKRELREQFGAPVPIRLPFGSGRGRVLIEVPAGLVLLAGGMAGLALAAPLDAIWHTRFGLDETPWSLPHAMLGTALLMIGLGGGRGPDRARGDDPDEALDDAAAVPAAPVRHAHACSGRSATPPPPPSWPPARRVRSRRTPPPSAPSRSTSSGTSPAPTRSSSSSERPGRASRSHVTRPFLHRTWVWLLVLLVFGWAVDGGTAGTARELGLESDAASTAGIPVLWAALPVAFLRPGRTWPTSWPAWCSGSSPTRSGGGATHPCWVSRRCRSPRWRRSRGRSPRGGRRTWCGPPGRERHRACWRSSSWPGRPSPARRPRPASCDLTPDHAPRSTRRSAHGPLRIAGL